MSARIRSRRNFAICVIVALIVSSMVILRNGSSSAAVHSMCTSSGLCSGAASAPVLQVRGKNLRIMAVGDSLTAGPFPDETNSYRKDLIQLLRGNTIDMVGSQNWGTMKPNELNRLEAGMMKVIEDIHGWLIVSLPKRRPNVILVHLGTNEVAWKQDLDTISDRLQAILELMIQECPDAAILVAQILPVGMRGPETLHYNQEVAQVVRSLADTGARVLLVDMYNPFAALKHEDNFIDLAHPNPTGYKRMAELWYDGIGRADNLGWIGEPIGRDVTVDKTAPIAPAS